MDREWMLLMVDERIKVLKEKKKMFTDRVNRKTGEVYGERYSCTQRSIIKRELSLCYLIRYFLVNTDIVFIDDVKAMYGFQKLVSPETRK